MNQTFIRCLDNELKTAALKKHANHKQTPREPEMPFKTLIDKIDQMDLTRTITNNHKRLYEVNQSTSSINEDIKQMSIACNNINKLNQNDLEQFERTICNVLNGINKTYDKKNFKGRPKFALFCSHCSSHGHTKGRCFKRPRRESIARPKEKSFYSHMRNNQNLPNRTIDSSNINGRQLPSTSPIYNNSRSRTPYRSQSRNNYNNNNNNNNTNPRDNRNYQGYRRSNNYNNRSNSYNRNNYSRNSNSYDRNYNYNRNNNSRSSSRYTDKNNSRQQSPYNKNNSYNSNNRQRYNSTDSSRNDKYRQRSNSNNRHYSNKNIKDNSRNQPQNDNYRHYNKERRNDGNRYNNNKNRINNIESDKQNDDPPGIDEYEYT